MSTVPSLGRNSSKKKNQEVMAHHRVPNNCISASSLLLASFCVINFHFSSCKTTNPMSDNIEKKAMNELLQTLRNRSQFVKVHAGEYLIWLGYPDETKKEFLEENEVHNKEPRYRVVIWRVLAQTETDPTKKEQWTRKIEDAFQDINGPDRLHAAETLGKLKISPLEKYPEATQDALSSDNRNLNVYTLWAISHSSDSAFEKNKREFLNLLISDSNQIVRKISAFILRNSGDLSEHDWNILADAAFSEPEESDLRTSLFNTASVTVPEKSSKTDRYKEIRKEMKKDHHRFSAGKRIELALSLAQKGTVDDVPVLSSILNDENIAGLYEANSDEGADARATAAYAILKIKQRAK
jgi:hypothetical protein